MASVPPMPWGHGRVLTGSVHTLAAGPAAPATLPAGTTAPATLTASPAAPVTRTAGPAATDEIEVPLSLRRNFIEGAVRLSASGLSGDENTSLDMAVSVYPWEHYPYWAEKLDLTLTDGAFGENVTTIGLLETEVFIGDIFDWGQASVQVTHPRRLRFRSAGTPSVRHTWRTGFYLRVLRSGAVSRDDRLVLSDVDPVGLSVADVNCAMTEGPRAAGLSTERLLLAAHLLPPTWVAHLTNRSLAGDQVPHGAAG